MVTPTGSCHGCGQPLRREDIDAGDHLAHPECWHTFATIHSAARAQRHARARARFTELWPGPWHIAFVRMPDEFGRYQTTARNTGEFAPRRDWRWIGYA